MALLPQRCGSLGGPTQRGSACWPTDLHSAAGADGSPRRCASSSARPRATATCAGGPCGPTAGGPGWTPGPLCVPSWLTVGGAEGQHPRRLAHAAGLSGQRDERLLAARRLPGVGLFSEKWAPVMRARPAPLPLLAWPRRAMSSTRRAVTVGAVPDVEHHDATRALGCLCLSYASSRVAEQHLWNTFLVRNAGDISSTIVWPSGVWTSHST